MGAFYEASPSKSDGSVVSAVKLRGGEMIKELLEKLTCKHEWGEGKAYSIHNVFANICGCTHGDGNRTQWFRKDVCKKCGKIKKVKL